MRIFISYAKEDRQQAALLAESLKSRGHKVFLDQNSLPAGETYEDQIEKAIRRSGLMIFLISPDSVAAGRFTRTELTHAEQKWPSAKGRVLPVFVRPTPIDDVPAYLRGVTILSPKGNLPAETALAAHKLASRLPRRLSQLTLILLLSGVGATAWWFYSLAPTPKMTVSATSPMPFERGLFAEPAKDNIVLTISNDGSLQARLIGLELEAIPAEALTVVGQGPDEIFSSGVVIGPSGSQTAHIIVNAPENIEIRYRVCAIFEKTARTCSLFADWEVNRSEDYLYGDIATVSPEIAAFSGPLDWANGKYLIAEGSRLYKLTETGESVEVGAFDAPIRSILFTGERLFVGVGGLSGKVYRLDPVTFAPLVKIDIAAPAGVTGTFGEEIDTTPVQLAHDGTRLWIRTGDDAGAASLFHAPYDLSAIDTVPYFEKISFDIREYRLRSAPWQNLVWTTLDSTTPNSLFALRPDSLVIFGGHDFELVSCSTDVMPAGAHLLLIDCDGAVKEVGFSDSRLYSRKNIDRVLGEKTDENSWSDVQLKRDAKGRILSATTTYERDPSAEYETSVLVERIGWDNGTQIVFETTDATITHWDVGDSTVLIALESVTGEQDIALVALEDD